MFVKWKLVYIKVILLNMYFLKQTHPTHNWNIKLEWIVMLFHSPTLYHVFTQHQGTEWRRKYFNTFSSSSSESFWRSWPSPDSWVKFSILPLPFLHFCCLALMQSILHNKTPAAKPRTHPQLPTHLSTQRTLTVTYIHFYPKSWIVWQQLGLVDGCLLATSIS